MAERNAECPACHSNVGLDGDGRMEPHTTWGQGDVAEAHAYWRTESGRPHPADRPLTAFNVAIEVPD